MRIRLPSRLFWKILAAILPPVVLAVCGIVWLQYNLARREMMGAIDRQIRFLAQNTADDIDQLLEQRYRDLFTLSESPLIADYYHNVDYGLLDEAESYRQELQLYLEHFSARSRVYARVLYLDARGRCVCRIGGKPGAPAELTSSDFAAAAHAPPGGWSVSPIEDLAGAGPVVFYVKPIRDDLGELKGMIVLGYDLAQVRGLLRNIEVGKRGRAYMRMPQGRFLQGRGPIAQGGLLVASSALKRRPWTVFVEAPLADFLEPLRSIRDAALLTALLGGAILAGILLLLVRSLTRPIAALVAAARRIGEGDLEHRIPAAGNDELGLLSGAFNEMAERLDSHQKQTSQLQSQLIQAEKLSAVGQLISAVAHELNNPLAAISAYVQLALLDDAPPKMRDDLARMQRNVQRCRKVVENLLFFVRQSRHERRRIGLNEAVASALELLEYRLVKTEDVRVIKELDPEAPAIAGDFQQIVQVLVNLVGNACDAMQSVTRYPEGKLLTIRTARRGERAVLEVEDNGGGIALELSEKVFQPFFTTKEPGRGTGLGLSICRQIVKEHGGGIELESRPGHRTVFHLSFPLAREEEFAALAAPAAPPPDEPVPGKRVLVADDEADVADVVARLLREDGDAVDVAYNGAEALKLLEGAAYDLVVTDVEMEHAKGTDLYASLSARGVLASCRMLFITGDILNAKVLEFLSKTGSEYLVKPFDIRELRQAARRLLRQAPR